jgi:hypothetical protein
VPEQRGRLASLGRRNHTDGSSKSALPCRFAHPRQPNGYELFARRVPVAGNALAMTGYCRIVGHRWAPPVPPYFLPGLMPNLLPTSGHRPIRCRGAPCIGLSPHCNTPRFPRFRLLYVHLERVPNGALPLNRAHRPAHFARQLSAYHQRQGLRAKEATG